MQIIDEETYLSINGAGRGSLGDAAFHKNKGNHSDKTWSKMVQEKAAKDWSILELREQLRKEYQLKVENKELRPPTRIERLIITANGHEDNESVQAARRLLTKRGVSW